MNTDPLFQVLAKTKGNGYNTKSLCSDNMTIMYKCYLVSSSQCMIFNLSCAVHFFPFVFFLLVCLLSPSGLPSTPLVLWYCKTIFCTLPISCLGFLMYVNLALLALLAFLCTTSIPSTFGLYILYHISTPTLVNSFLSKIPVSTPRLRILMHTPAKGSPVLRRTRRISPTLAASGFVLENRLVRAPVGSRTAICSA
ncbi:hypothetical protein SS1G_07695 [Sclerotinia sclerotiorum 1980 UF-70]|uniref:Uncharacterized protein n=1 Tax=Sclerotinia sclerotiorum (strain ATCC 18683 / 1980 / Ss-1) TaxID=665079 RepID=A7EQU2_SCLS1|nr:hypothetical protein SS1G_07695 [Sclerotinia sclerotiorum 1980 UF-70]EDN91834.1 hypothetical protein SS1G_07695 [Sclerotinia sclerotiorum 1980 UF-70]